LKKNEKDTKAEEREEKRCSYLDKNEEIYEVHEERYDNDMNGEENRKEINSVEIRS